MQALHSRCGLTKSDDMLSIHGKHPHSCCTLPCAAVLVFVIALQVLCAHGMQLWLISISFKAGGDTQVSRLSCWHVHQRMDTPLVLGIQIIGAYAS